MKSLTEKDRRILELRIKNYTYEEIAAKLGYKTHSAVVKRIKRIGAAYQKYAKMIISSASVRQVLAFTFTIKALNKLRKVLAPSLS